MTVQPLRSDEIATVPQALTLSDQEIVERVKGGEYPLFEVLMRRHNQRTYRTVRAVLRDETEVEDVMQQAYINAFTHLQQFEERSRFSTWLTRIALNEAFARRRKTRLSSSRHDAESGAESMVAISSPQPDPERQAYTRELHRMLEDAIDALPETYRLVFMLRDVEGLSTSETSEGLGLSEDAIKTRLHRARAMVRRRVSERIGDAAQSVFQFPAPRCNRIVAGVFARIC